MPSWSKKRPSTDDEEWTIDDDWLSLDDDGRSPTERAQLVLGGAMLILLIALCAGVIWFMSGDQSPPITSALPITAVPDTIVPSVRVTAVAATNHPVTATPIPVTPTQSSQLPLPANYDPPALAALMLDLVNGERMANGLSPVVLDTTATLAGRLHAEDMAQFNYFSHWNRDGLGPDHRYTLVGGQHAVMENLHAFSYTYDNGQGAPIESWSEVIQNAHTGLMNSPGHRANILDPAHTHVGIGMAYNPQTGQFLLAQEFTNQYTRLEQPLPRQAQPADTITVRGQFIGSNLSNPLLQLAYEPFPQPMSLEELGRTSTYSSTTIDVETRRTDLAFAETVELPPGQRGLYHIRLFVDVQNQQALVLDHVIEVR